MHIACVGNAILDALIAFSPADLQEYSTDSALTLPLGDKILISQSELQIGGNAANVSVGLSRLSHQASIFAEIGDDLLGRFIEQSLAQEQVDTKHVVKKGKTALDIVLNAQIDRVILVDHQKRSNEFVLPYESLDGVYLTSLADNWENVYSQACEASKLHPLTIACNPGSVQLKEKERFLPFLPHITILIVNVQEAAQLINHTKKIKKGESEKKTREYIRELFTGLFSLGGSVVVITDGIAGSYAASKEDKKIYFCPTFGTPVVEKTGAGDAYATGFFASFLTGSPMEGRLLSGTANGSSVVEHVGAQRGLLTAEEMIERKKLAKSPVEVLEL